MPANFSPEEKQAITNRLYQEGFRMLQQSGLKKLRISDLAKSCQIGTGTFYNFFPSKQDFVVSLILRAKQKSIENFELLAKDYPQGIPLAALHRFLLNNLLENNIYRFLSQAEYNSLADKIPSLEDPRNLKQMAQYMQGKLASNRGLAEFKLFAEAYKIIVIGSSDLSKLDPEQLEPVLSHLVRSACQLLY